MAIKISDLANQTNPQPEDVLPIVDIGDGTTKKIRADILVGAFLPTAMITPYAGTTAPTGWLLCDGSPVSRATYSSLFTLVGTAYGAGDGATTFNVPDMRGKIPVGKSAESEFNAMGKTGGAKTHTLAGSEMPSHQHTGSTSVDGYHTHNLVGSNNDVVTNAGAVEWSQHVDVRNDGGMQGAGSHAHSFSTSWVGGSGAHNNLQPYNTINYIIKA